MLLSGTTRAARRAGSVRLWVSSANKSWACSPSWCLIACAYIGERYGLHGGVSAEKERSDFLAAFMPTLMNSNAAQFYGGGVRAKWSP